MYERKVNEVHQAYVTVIDVNEARIARGEEPVQPEDWLKEYGTDKVMLPIYAEVGGLYVADREVLEVFDDRESISIGGRRPRWERIR